MKIALVHDDFCQVGGAENLFAEIASIYPNAPIYTSLVNWNKLPTAISRNRIRPSFMQKIPYATKFYKLLLPFYPLAFESFDFSNFDLVISSTTRFAKSIVTPAKTVHICYINSVPRFLWHQEHKSNYLSAPLELATRPLINWLKRWDISAAARVDFLIANSQNVKDQVKKVYSRDSRIIHPFANTDFFQPAKIHGKNQKYYLIVSRLVKWKRIDIAIYACKSKGVNLKIVGTGPDTLRLKKLSTVNRQPLAPRSLGEAGSTVEFLGNVSSEKLRELYQNAQSLIVTQEEDFGIAAAEAQACGVPVIAYGRGGQKEIIKENLTGLFFTSQTASSLEDAIGKASEVKWNLQQIRESGEGFSRHRFTKSLKAIVQEYAKKS